VPKWRDPIDEQVQTVAELYTPKTDTPRRAPEDIAAVLNVLGRADPKFRSKRPEDRRLVLMACDLRGARLANLNFTGDAFSECRFENTAMRNCNFERSNFFHAHFENSFLFFCNFTRALLLQARFDGALIADSNFGGADIRDAHFEGANLMHVTGIKQSDLDQTFGDADTAAPRNLTRPSSWPPGSAASQTDTFSKMVEGYQRGQTSRRRSWFDR